MPVPRSLTFSSTRRDARRRRRRVLTAGVAALAVVAVVWMALVAGVWGYAWLRLGGDDRPALHDDLAPLGSAGANAPAGATTVLLAMTDSVDPTVPRPSALIGPVVLLQYGGPRERPAALVLPPDVPVTVDGAGTLPLAEVQLEGGTDLLVRAVVDYTEVRVDHVVSASVDVLPRLVDMLGPLPGCDDAICSDASAGALRTAAEALPPQDLVHRLAAAVRAVSGRLDAGWVVRSPLAAKRTVEVIDRELSSDASLRGARLLQVAAAIEDAGDLEVAALPTAAGPVEGRRVVLEESAAVRFQHLRDGTPFADDAAGDDAVDAVEDVSVAVLNGAGVDGLAGDVRVRVETQGFTVVGTGNAPSFDRQRSVVHYAEGNEDVEMAAVRIAQELGDAALEPVEKRPTFEGDEVDLLVIAGHDVREP